MLGIILTVVMLTSVVKTSEPKCYTIRNTRIVQNHWMNLHTNFRKTIFIIWAKPGKGNEARHWVAGGGVGGGIGFTRGWV